MRCSIVLLVLLVLSIEDIKSAKAAITTNGCGSTKTCFRNPDNCAITDSSCGFFSWAPNNQSAGMYTFEMSGGTGNQQYIAMALATESKMANADLYYCDGTTVRTGAIQSLHQPPQYYAMTNGLNQISAAIENNIAHCAFTRPASVTRNISNDVAHDFNIEKTQYYLLGAIGPMNGEQIQRHNVWRQTTSYAIDFSANPVVATTSGTDTVSTAAPEVSTAAPVVSTATAVVSEGCGTSKTCFHSPDNCEVGTSGCHFYSWKKDGNSTYEFEIVGSSGSGAQYAAIALGTQSLMVDADMYYCDGKVVRSGVITTQHEAPFYPGTNGLVTTSAQTINGVAHCKFSRPSSVVRTISDGVEKTFDLNAEKYFLLAASGPMRNPGASNDISVHTWKTKTSNRIIGSSTGKLSAILPAWMGLMALFVIKAAQDLTA